MTVSMRVTSTPEQLAPALSTVSRVSVAHRSASAASPRKAAAQAITERLVPTRGELLARGDAKS
jgi:hypothetical protein